MSLLPSSQGYSYLLTMMDRMACLLEVAHLSSISAESCVHAFLATWISRFGVPPFLHQTGVLNSPPLLRLGSRIDVVSVDRLKPVFSTDPVSVAVPATREYPVLHPPDLLDLLAPPFAEAPDPTSPRKAVFFSCLLLLLFDEILEGQFEI